MTLPLKAGGTGREPVAFRNPEPSLDAARRRIRSPKILSEHLAPHRDTVSLLVVGAQTHANTCPIVQRSKNPWNPKIT